MTLPSAPPRAPRRALPARLSGWLVLLVVLALPSVAHAYPWMIRHQYASCAMCHTDPSGGGMLTAYGRAQSEVLLASRTQPPSETGEVSPSTGFLFGAVLPPDWLNLGFSFRGGALANHTAQATAVYPIQMVSDVRAQVTLGQVRAFASLGYAMRRALPAALTSRPDNNLVSREHWVGVDAFDQSVLLRVGRINLPFGLRSVEHTAWVRSATRTDINDSQQHGLAVAYNNENVRAEVMGFIGNLQLQPSYYREHGYSGYAELALAPNAAVGVSSLMAQARYDVATQEPFHLRQAHGAFGRWAPWQPLVLMAEVDALHERSPGMPGQPGLAGLVQADLEPVQGLHFILTGETLRRPTLQGTGGWLSAVWFFNPHMDVRVDAMFRRTVTSGAPADTATVLAMYHLSL